MQVGAAVCTEPKEQPAAEAAAEPCVQGQLLLVPLKPSSLAHFLWFAQDWKDVKKRKLEEAMSKAGQVFVNLQTVNYILHGIQYYRESEPAWRDTFWRGFGLDRLHDSVTNDMEKLCTHVVQWCMTPFGVVASDAFNMSDQGVSLVVDGRVEMMRNYWATFVEDAQVCTLFLSV